MIDFEPTIPIGYDSPYRSDEVPTTGRGAVLALIAVAAAVLGGWLLAGGVR